MTFEGDGIIYDLRACFFCCSGLPQSSPNNRNLRYLLLLFYKSYLIVLSKVYGIVAVFNNIY